MSKTNFSILIPFGLSGLISWPPASTYGIFFWATWCCSLGSCFLIHKQSNTGSLQHIYFIVTVSNKKLLSIKKWDFLTGKSTNRMKVKILLHYVSEEGKTEEVIGHISCIEHESAIGAALLRRFQGDLAVFHHLITPVHLTHHTHCLSRICFLHHLETQKTWEL